MSELSKLSSRLIDQLKDDYLVKMFLSVHGRTKSPMLWSDKEFIELRTWFLQMIAKDDGCMLLELNTFDLMLRNSSQKSSSLSELIGISFVTAALVDLSVGLWSGTSLRISCAKDSRASWEPHRPYFLSKLKCSQISLVSLERGVVARNLVNL